MGRLPVPLMLDESLGVLTPNLLLKGLADANTLSWFVLNRGVPCHERINDVTQSSNNGDLVSSNGLPGVQFVKGDSEFLDMGTSTAFLPADPGGPDVICQLDVICSVQSISGINTVWSKGADVNAADGAFSVATATARMQVDFRANFNGPAPGTGSLSSQHGNPLRTDAGFLTVDTLYHVRAYWDGTRSQGHNARLIVNNTVADTYDSGASNLKGVENTTGESLYFGRGNGIYGSVTVHEAMVSNAIKLATVL